MSETKGGNKMFFIDYGHTETIPLSAMYCVKSSHPELLKFPPQAIRAKLSGMRNIAVDKMVSRLRSCFSLKRNAYVKNMQSNGIVPEVKLYFEAETFMVCVNDSFELECERNQYRTITTSIPDGCDDERSCAKSDEVSIGGGELLQDTLKIGTFLPPKISSCFDIVIAQTESPSNFVIKPVKYLSLWQKQMKTLQSYCKETSATVSLDMIEEGEPYACLKSNGYWYRALIIFHRTKMFAFVCDIADVDNIEDVKKIKILPEEYRTIPKLAMNAKLFGIKPAKGTWDLDDNFQFHRITKGRIFQAEVAKVIFDEKVEENPMLELRLLYKSECINNLFVQSGRAVVNID